MTFLSSCFSNGFVYIFIPSWGILNPSIVSMLEEIQTPAWLQAQALLQLGSCSAASSSCQCGEGDGGWKRHCAVPLLWGCWGVTRGTLSSKHCHQQAASSAAEKHFPWPSADITAHSGGERPQEMWLSTLKHAYRTGTVWQWLRLELWFIWTKNETAMQRHCPGLTTYLWHWFNANNAVPSKRENAFFSLLHLELCSQCSEGETKLAVFPKIIMTWHKMHLFKKHCSRISPAPGRSWRYISLQ